MSPIARASFSLFIAVGAAASCNDKDTTLFDDALIADAGSELGSLTADRDGGSNSGSTSTGHEDAGTSGAEVAISIPSPSGATSPGVVDSETSGSSPPSVADAGTQSEATQVPDCTGCVRISVSPSTNQSEGADYALQLASSWDMSQTVITWRVRVFDFDGNLSLIAYADAEDDEEFATGMATINAKGGWRELNVDLSRAAAFRAPASNDAGVQDPGFAFDKSKIRRVGLGIRADQVTSGAARATLELDSVTFSNFPAVSADFSTSQAGFALVAGDATVTEVPE